MLLIYRKKWGRPRQSERETKDVLRCVQKAMGHDVTALTVVNSVGSIIARTTKLGVYLNAGRENAVASTKAFTTQVTVMALLACWFHDLRNENHSPKFEQLMASLHRLPISFGMGLRLQEQCRRWAQRLVEAEHIFILGKGYAEPIAREGALKVKECAYVHAEGLSGGAMKHGPFALISEDLAKKTPIIMLILDDEHSHLMRTAAEEVKARHAEVFVITDAPHLAKGLDDDPIVIPRNGNSRLISGLPQFSPTKALLRGVNPDFWRHPAKADGSERSLGTAGSAVSAVPVLSREPAPPTAVSAPSVRVLLGQFSPGAALGSRWNRLAAQHTSKLWKRLLLKLRLRTVSHAPAPRFASKTSKYSYQPRIPQEGCPSPPPAF